MPFRFFKRIKIAPGVSLNISKKGVSISAGPKGAKITASTTGKLTASANIPIPGLSFRETINTNKKPKKKATGRPRKSRSSTKAGTPYISEPNRVNVENVETDKYCFICKTAEATIGGCCQSCDDSLMARAKTVRQRRTQQPKEENPVKAEPEHCLDFYNRGGDYDINDDINNGKYEIVQSGSPKREYKTTPDEINFIIALKERAKGHMEHITYFRVCDGSVRFQYMDNTHLGNLKLQGKARYITVGSKRQEGGIMYYIDEWINIINKRIERKTEILKAIEGA